MLCSNLKCDFGHLYLAKFLFKSFKQNPKCRYLTRTAPKTVCRFVSILEDISYLMKQEDQGDLEELQGALPFSTGSMRDVALAMDICQVMEGAGLSRHTTELPLAVIYLYRYHYYIVSLYYYTACSISLSSVAVLGGTIMYLYCTTLPSLRSCLIDCH